MNGIVVQVGAANEVFASLKSEWQQLFASAKCSPFLSWEWMSVWFESFGNGRTPFILKAHRDGKLIGIFPMFLEKRRILGMRFDRLSMMGDGPGGADYLDLIASPDDKPDALSEIFTFLKDAHYSDLVRLENVAADSETIRLIKCLNRTEGAPALRFSTSVTAVCPQIDLSGGWESVLKASKRRNNFKQRLKKLEKLDGFEFRTVTAPDGIVKAFDRFLRLHEMRWTNAGGSELTGHPRLVAFQRKLISELGDAGFIRFDELWFQGECRSSVYGLDDGNTFYNYSSGSDPEFSSLSVGLVLLGLSVKNASQRGNTTYDFLRGDESYKFDWANQTNHLVTVNLNRNTVPVAVYEAIERTWGKIREVLKKAFPRAIADSLRTWRRTWKRSHDLSAR